jgi:hypothetical protein
VDAKSWAVARWRIGDRQLAMPCFFADLEQR